MSMITRASEWRRQAGRGAALSFFLLGLGFPAQGASAQTQSLAAAVATADSVVAAAVAQGVIPGAQMLIAVDGKVLLERAYGYAQLNDFSNQRLASPRPLRTSTLFDLASVTKVMAATYAVMVLVDQGRIDVDAPVHRYLPDFRGPHLDSITVRHLLTHTAGFVQWQPLYYMGSTKAQTYRTIREMPLQWGVGQGRHYSDLGFMMLGYLVEKVSGSPLDVFLHDSLYGPLGLRSTTYNPKARGHTDFAVTESGNGYERKMVHDTSFGYRYRGDPAAWNGWRQYVLDGETNDGNAWYANGGVAGHAGLFSTAGELKVLLEVLLGRGSYKGRQYLKPEVVELFLKPGAHLGWAETNNAPPTSFSHGGFTGTYVIGVPEAKLAFILLTNRQNLGANAQGYFTNVGPISQGALRPLIAALLPTFVPARPDSSRRRAP